MKTHRFGANESGSEMSKSIFLEMRHNHKVGSLIELSYYEK